MCRNSAEIWGVWGRNVLSKMLHPPKTSCFLCFSVLFVSLLVGKQTCGRMDPHQLQSPWGTCVQRIIMVMMTQVFREKKKKQDANMEIIAIKTL